MAEDAWSSGRLSDRFADLDRRLADLELDVRAFGPAVGQAATAIAGVDELEHELKLVRAELVLVERAAAKEVKDAQTAARTAIDAANTTANDVIRSGRSENLKLIGIVVGAFSSVVMAVLALLATGRLG